MATQHNFRIKNGLEVGGVLIVNSSGELQAASISGAITATSLQLGGDANPTLTGNGTYLKITTSDGYIDIGAGSANFLHITTDRPSFYFNKKLIVNEGIVQSYDEDLNLNRAGSSTARLRITAGTTISDQALTAPSVGVTNIVTNKVVKFNGTILDDSNITDSGSLITLGSNTTVSGSLTGTTGTFFANAAAGTNALNILGSSNGSGTGITFSDNGTPAASSSGQNGYMYYYHGDGQSYGSGNAFILTSSELTTTILADGKLMYKEGIYSKPASGTGAGTRKDANWDTAYGWGDHGAVGYSILTSNETVSGFKTFTHASGIKYYGTAASPLWLSRSSGTNVNIRLSSSSGTTYVGQGASSGTLKVGTTADLQGAGDTVWHTGTLTTTNKSNYDTAYGWGDHGTESYATQTYVGTQITNLIDSSPAALNTLNELAAALGDNENFATDTATAIGLKLPLAGGTITGQVEFPSSVSNRPVLTGGFLSRQTGDGDADIWGISETYYPSEGTAANAWGIRWASSPNHIQFVGANANKVTFDLDNGAINSGAITSTGTSVFDRIKTGYGTVASPAVQVGDNDSGFYDSGGNMIGISLGGVLEYDFSSTQLDMKANNLNGVGTISSGAIASTGTSVFDRIQTGLGTVASPAVQVGDNDSGFYDSGANIVGVALGGVLEYEFAPTQFDMKANNLVGGGAATFAGNVAVGTSGTSTSFTVGGDHGAEYWTKAYSVSASTIGELVNQDGTSLETGGAYRFTAHIDGTGTDQSSRAVFWNENGTWNVNVTGQSGTSSNHIQFLVSSGVPSVKTYHTNNYTVRVWHERLNLNENTGTDNSEHYFGADAYLSKITDTLSLNSPTTVSGNLTSSGMVRADTHFNSTDTNATLSATGTGNVYLRPNGTTSTTGQVHIASSGNATFAGAITSTGNVSLDQADGFVYLNNQGVGNAGIYVRGITSSSTLRSHSTDNFRWEVTGGQKMELDSSGVLNAVGGYQVNGTTVINSSRTVLAHQYYYLNTLIMAQGTDTYLRINQSNQFTNGTWFGNSNIYNSSSKYIASGSNGGTTSSRVYMYGGSYNGTNVIALDGTDGKIKGSYYAVGGTTVIDTSRNLINVASINVNHSSDLSGTQVYIKKLDESTNLQRWGEGTSGQSTYRFRIDQGFKFIANSGSGDKFTLFSDTGNVTTDGTLSSGAITSTVVNTADATLLTLHHDTGGDIVQQKSFIDFSFEDDNTNETPQVRIGAEVGQNANADTQEKEGSGAFVVYTNNAESITGAAGASLAERMRVDYRGYVGIGTTTPAAPLHVVSGTTLTAKFEGATNAYMDFTDGSVTTRFQNSGGFFIGTESNHNVSIKTGGTGVKMTVEAGGNVGIGETNPGQKLQVNGNIRADGHYYVGGSIVIDSNRNLTNIGTITNSGVIRQTISNVGIPTVYSSFTMEAADAHMDLVSSSAGTWGSALNFVQGTSTTANTDVWSIARKTTSGGNSLNFNFGTNNQHDNTTQVSISTTGDITTSGSILVQTAVPTLRLKTSANSNDPYFSMESSGATTTEGFEMWYVNNVGDMHISTTYPNVAASMRFHTASGGNKSTNNERFTIQGDGNINIVAGDLRMGGDVLVDSSRNITAGTIRSNGDYYGDAAASVRYRGYGDTPILQGVSGATYLYAGGSTTTALTLQAGRTVAPILSIGQVNSYSDVITSARAIQNVTSVSMSGNLLMSKAAPWLIIENTTEDSGGIVFNDNQAGAATTSGPPTSSQAFRMAYNCSGTGGPMTMGHDDDSYGGFIFAIGGNFTASGNITAYSDERLKENIQTLDSKKTLQMRGVSFTKDGKESSGVIAQEIEKIAPELVQTNEQDGYKSVAYGNLVGYLIETAKEQQKEIDELKQLINNIIKSNSKEN